VKSGNNGFDRYLDKILKAGLESLFKSNNKKPANRFQQMQKDRTDMFEYESISVLGPGWRYNKKLNCHYRKME
jgi:hypothetical protein